MTPEKRIANPIAAIVAAATQVFCAQIVPRAMSGIPASASPT
jgi:hypothetical protein